MIKSTWFYFLLYMCTLTVTSNSPSLQWVEVYPWRNTRSLRWTLSWIKYLFSSQMCCHFKTMWDFSTFVMRRFVCVKIHVSRYKNILPPFLKYRSIVTSRVSISFDPCLIKLELRGLISRVYAHMCMSHDEYLIGVNFTKFLVLYFELVKINVPFY